MDARWLLAVMVVLGTAGCIEKRQPAGEPKAAPDAPAAGDIVRDYAKTVGTAPARSASTIDTAALQAAVRQFEAMEGRKPRSLEELVAERYLPQLPALAPGQRFTYDPATGTVGVAGP